MKIPFYRQDWDVSKYRSMGFGNKEDCEYWKNSACGVLCLRMAVESWGGSVIGIKKYIDEGVAIGAYSHKNGWNHAGLAELAGKFGLSASNSVSLKTESIKDCLVKGGLVMISIKTAFKTKRNWREKIFFWRKRGGHLCLISGFETQNRRITGFRVQHTSIRSEWNWRDKIIPIDQFIGSSTGRGVVFFRS